MNSYDVFNRRLKLLGFSSYSDYLQSSHWINFKKRCWREKKRRACYGCGRGPKSVRLSLHHKTYKRLGREFLSDVVFVCDRCHNESHSHKGLWVGIEKVRVKRHPSKKSWMSRFGFLRR